MWTNGSMTLFDSAMVPYCSLKLVRANRWPFYRPTLIILDLSSNRSSIPSSIISCVGRVWDTQHCVCKSLSFQFLYRLLTVYRSTIPAQLYLLDNWGRRSSAIVGGLVMAVCMFTIGSLYAAEAQNGQGRWAIIVLIYVCLPVFGSTSVGSTLMPNL
jgi:hypothetical protein